MPTDPEEAGRLAAEALVANLEKLKQELAGPEASPERQLASGEVAVEAMKHLLGEAMNRLRNAP